MKASFLLCFLIAFSVNNIYVQNKTVSGKVIGEDFKNLPYVPIFINDTVQIGKTDLNGFFQIDIPISVKKISFRYIGMESASIDIADSCNEVEVIMMLRGTYDFKAIRKADRLRLKRFNKLPELYREAFTKGVFKKDKPCYKQEFVY